MFKNRVSLSIVLGFFAAFLALHCELAASQTVTSAAPRPANIQQKSASLGVRVQVMATCRFVTGSIATAEDLRRWILSQNSGSLSARCGASQPLLVSLSSAQTSSPAPVTGSATQASTSGGSPYVVAQAAENQLQISF